VMIKLRNTSPAFGGELTASSTNEHCLVLTWKYQECTATLDANLHDFSFSITHKENAGVENVMSQK